MLTRDRQAAELAGARGRALIFWVGRGLSGGRASGGRAPRGRARGRARGLRWGSCWSKMAGTAWPSYMLTRGWLALRHRLPWPLMGFLADAQPAGCPPASRRGLPVPAHSTTAPGSPTGTQTSSKPTHRLVLPKRMNSPSYRNSTKAAGKQSTPVTCSHTRAGADLVKSMPVGTGSCPLSAQAPGKLPRAFLYASAVALPGGNGIDSRPFRAHVRACSPSIHRP